MMGGLGSGRLDYPNAKQTTRMYSAIDVRAWKRSGLLEPGRYFMWALSGGGDGAAVIDVQTEADRVMLTYQHYNHYGSWVERHYAVYLDWTACHFGGSRPWFLCPSPNCARRVALLFLGGFFACRHCHNLAYASQRETRDARAVRQADKIRRRLRWVPGIVNGHGGKPVGMHWSTFNRLVAKHDELAGIWGAGLSRQLQPVYDLVENCRDG